MASLNDLMHRFYEKFFKSGDRLPVDVGGQITVQEVNIGEVKQGARGENAEPWQVTLSGSDVPIPIRIPISVTSKTNISVDPLTTVVLETFDERDGYYDRFRVGAVLNTPGDLLLQIDQARDVATLGSTTDGSYMRNHELPLENDSDHPWHLHSRDQPIIGGAWRLKVRNTNSVSTRVVNSYTVRRIPS